MIRLLKKWVLENIIFLGILCVEKEKIEDLVLSRKGRDFRVLLIYKIIL